MEQISFLDIIKNHLRIIYTCPEQKESHIFFKNLIDNPVDCQNLLDCLLGIIISDEDDSLKKISIVIIREMNFDFILRSIFILNQKINPFFTDTIEILTDFLALKQNSELIPIINNYLQNNPDFIKQKAILQIISSLKYYWCNRIKIEIFLDVLFYYEEFFRNTLSEIMSHQEIDLHEIYFIYYFVLSFDDVLNQSKNFELVYNLLLFCLAKKINTEIFQRIINKVIKIFSKVFYFGAQYLSGKIFPLVALFDEYCTFANYIPETSLFFWGFLFLNTDKIEIPENFGDLIIKYIFPFIQYQPQLIHENPSSFLMDFTTDWSTPISCFYANLQIIHEFPPLSEFIFNFAESYFQQYITQNVFEICRLLIIFSRFTYLHTMQNQNYTINFYRSKILPMILKLSSMENPNIYLLISICDFIQYVNSNNDHELFVNEDSLHILVNFIKNSITFSFRFDEEGIVLFYFALNAINKKFFDDESHNCIHLFNFEEKDLQNIFIRAIELNNLFQSETTRTLLEFTVRFLLPVDFDALKLVNTIWEFLQTLKGNLENDNSFLINKYFGIIETIFEKSQTIEEKQMVFNEVIQLLRGEIETSKEWIIYNCFNKLLDLMNTFTDLFMEPEQLPLLMNSIGMFIINLLNMVDENLKPSDDLELNECVTSLYTFGFIISMKVNDPNMCVELVIENFFIPAIIKLNQIHLMNSESPFDFDSLSTPLIKFHEDEGIFQCYLKNLQVFQQLEKLSNDTKSSILTSMIVSKPSFLLQSFDRDQCFNIINSDFKNSISYIFFFAVHEILQYFIKNGGANMELLSLLNNNFLERVVEENVFQNGEPSTDLESDLYYKYKILFLSPNRLFSEINQFFSRLGLPIPSPI